MLTLSRGIYRYIMRDRISWALMGIFGLMLIVIGFQGSLGKILACILTPSLIVVNSE